MLRFHQFPPSGSFWVGRRWYFGLKLDSILSCLTSRERSLHCCCLDLLLSYSTFFDMKDERYFLWFLWYMNQYLQYFLWHIIISLSPSQSGRRLSQSTKRRRRRSVVVTWKVSAVLLMPKMVTISETSCSSMSQIFRKKHTPAYALLLGQTVRPLCALQCRPQKTSVGWNGLPTLP